MLRCPPSCINLTSPDVAGLEKRLGARQSSCNSTERVPDIRLSRGPHHPTRFSIVPAEDNVGRKRAESSSSEATFYDGSDENPGGRFLASLDGSRTVASPERHAEHRLLSSARARRRYARSHDIAIHEDGPMLDPDAPVFVPRIRFGSVESVGPAVLEPRWGSLDTTHNASYLRIRSTTEQNVEPQFRQDHSADRETTESTQGLAHSQARATTYQQRSRGVDQNTAIVQPSPGVERYPVLRPSSSSSPYPRTSSLLRPSLGEPQNISRRHPTPVHALHDISALDRRPLQLRVQPVFVDGPNDTTSLAATNTRPVSPAVSTASRSTPNLLSLPGIAPRTSSRGSSLSLTQSRPHHCPPQHRVPSMVSAASGISSSDDLEQAEGYNLRRNSPLDELTERFSRMRSVGRSWERMPDARLSLLNGDPFGQTPFQEVEGSAATVADPVALSLALPPSSSLHLAHSQPVVTNVIARPMNTSQQIRRRRTGDHPSEAENDSEAHIPGLEEDRRTWLSRREVGTLDVTPPKEGRFEQFLS